MPGNSAKSQGALQTLLINDWTSGIISQDYGVESAGPGPSPNSSNRITSSFNTYGVTGLPSGGLLLGPSINGGFSQALSNVPAGNTKALVTGTMGYVDGTIANSILLAVTMFNSSAGTSTVNLYDISGRNVFTTFNTLTGDLTSTPSHPFSTILIASSGQAGNFIGIGRNLNLSNGGGWNYPVTDQWTPGTPKAQSSLGSGIGIAIPANGRVWQFANTAVSAVITNTIYSGVNYTDPSILTNLTFGTQGTLIDYDNPSSFGGWGTVSSSEVLLVKTGMGGVIVSGDIFNPTISRTPAVFGTNGLFGNAAQTPIGLVYRSALNGVWVWSGGAAASKLSSNIADIVWGQTNSGYNVQLYKNFIFTDQGYFMDINTNAWWRLPPWQYNGSAFAAGPNNLTSPTYYTFFDSSVGPSPFDFIVWGADSIAGDHITATQLIFDNSNPGVIATPPAGFYHSYWESNPITLSSDNYAEVEEVSFVIKGAGTLFVSTLGVNGAILSAKSVVINHTTYARVRMVVSFQTDVLTMQVGFKNQIGATGNVVPIIGSIEVKYRTTTPVRVAN